MISELKSNYVDEQSKLAEDNHEEDLKAKKKKSSNKNTKNK